VPEALAVGQDRVANRASLDYKTKTVKWCLLVIDHAEGGGSVSAMTRLGPARPGLA